MAESVKFTDGVSRLEGSPLSAPFDIRNAYIKPTHIVEALNSPSSETGIVSPSAGKKITQHNTDWFSVRSSLKYRGILYAARRNPSRIDVYPEDFSEPEGDIPRILTVEKEGAGSNAVPGLSDTRVVQYIFIPVNKRGEAGIWHYEAWVIDGDFQESRNLPRFTVDATEQTDYIEVYKTAEMKEGSKSPPTQSFHYLDRFSGSSIEGSGVNYFTMDYDSRPDYDLNNYLDQYGISYIYLSNSRSMSTLGVSGDPIIKNVGFPDGSIEGHRIQFLDRVAGSVDLEEGKEYYVDSVESGPYGNRNVKVNIVDSNGDSLSFDGGHVLTESEELAGDIVFNGVPVRIKPPEGFESNSSKFYILDSRQWAWDAEINGDEANFQPSGRVLERDRTLHGRTVSEESASGANRSGDDRFTVSGADVTDKYSVGEMVTFESDASLITTVSSGLLGEINLSGSATVSVTSGNDFVLVIEDISYNRTARRQAVEYRVKGGSPDYTIQLLNRSTFSDASYGVVEQETVSSDGDYQIEHDNIKPGTPYEYILKATDAGSNSAESQPETGTATEDDDVLDV